MNFIEQKKEEYEKQFDDFNAGMKCVGWNHKEDKAIMRMPFNSTQMWSFIEQALTEQAKLLAECERRGVSTKITTK